MPTPSASSVPLIKGYLPVRLLIPSHDGRGGGDDTDETFFFVREHQGRSTDSKTTNNNESSAMERGSTLFVANAPMVPGVSTGCLLKSIFGRFGVVTRVTAVQNPRASALVHEDGASGITIADTMTMSSFSWSDSEIMFKPSFLPPILSSVEGKYAHVVFSSAKEMKNAKKELENLMTANSGRKNSRRHSKGRNKKGRKNLNGNEEEGEQNEIPPRTLIIDKLEIQTLSDESQRQHNEVLKNVFKEGDDGHTDNEYGGNNDNDSVGNTNNIAMQCAGILAVSHRYRETSKLLRNRTKLMEECNTVMEAYENAEEAKLKAQEIAKSEPDSNGFITVSYSNAVGSKVELEQSKTATTPSRRNGNKRSRKKKDAIGTLELKDFYRFQRKDNRKRTMEDLRRQFEEDVRKVKRLKEEKEYRPF